jgi:hypothetical protein
MPPGRRQPVSKQLFLEHFWWCHSRLADKADAEYGMAAYFRFLTLVGAHALKSALWLLRIRTWLVPRVCMTACARPLSVKAPRQRLIWAGLSAAALLCFSRRQAT